MALYNAGQITEALTNAPAVDPNLIWRQMGGVSYFGGATQDVYTAAQQYSNMWYTYENAPCMYRELYLNPYLEAWQEGGGAVTPTATEVLVPQASVNAQTGIVEGTTAARMPATTTPVGNVKAGALAGRIPIGTLIAGTAIGAGVGLKEVATHREFWDDLSDAVFNDLKNPDTYIYKPLAETETANVIWRCMEDGSIQGYCDKRDIDSVVNRLYQFDAFNVVDSIEYDIDHTGTQTIVSGEHNVGFLFRAASLLGLTSYPNLAAFYSLAVNTFGSQANIYSCQVNYNDTYGVLYVRVNCYSVPDGVYNVQYDGEYFVGTDTAHRIGYAAGQIAMDTGAIIEINTGTGGMSDRVYGGEYVQESGISHLARVSNLGSFYHAKNENVIYNGTDQLPPADPNDFWSTFATWLANGFNVTAYNPLTNANETTTYVPFTAPENNWQIQDITGDQSRVWQGLYDFVSPFTTPTTDPINNPSPWIFESIGNFTNPGAKTPDPTPWDNTPKFPTPTPTPNGSSPTISAPTSGVASGNKLYTVYNPTQSEVDALGGYLWTQNIIELISQFFKNNPLEAIISLHLIYCTPTTGTRKNIILGYLDSNVAANTVTSQYEDLACGYVDVPEMYGNVLDYTGVAVQVFLPFVGFRVLKTKEVMGRRIEIDYKIDVYTGVCLAMIYAISANTRQLLYTFEGNCSVQIPLTAADRTRLIAGLTTAGISAFTGNPAGVVGGIASIGTNIERSGSFSGNAGAMGVKKPYIIITRAIDAQASHYNTLYGYPLNKYGYLRNFRGYTRVQSVHVDIPGATDREKTMIESALKSGIKI